MQKRWQELEESKWHDWLYSEVVVSFAYCSKYLFVRLPFPIDASARNYINVCFRPQTTLCHFLFVECFQTLKMILERLTMWNRTTLVDQISFKSAAKYDSAKQLHDVPVRCESFAIALESFVHLWCLLRVDLWVWCAYRNALYHFYE